MNVVFSPRGGIALIILCCVASALPVILFPYFPSQDGPAHSYSAWALAQLHGGSDLFSRYFRETHPLTNWASGAVFDALGHFTTPRGFEKGFALTYVAMMEAAALATTRWLLKVDIRLSTLFFPLIFSHMLHMGSFNVALADAAFIPFIGVCHLYVTQPKPSRAFWAGLMLLLIFALHVQIVLLALLYTAVCVLWLGFQALRQRAHKAAGPGGYLIRHAAWLVLASLPANAMCLVFALQSRGMENHPHYIGILHKAFHLFKLSAIATYSLFDLMTCALLSLTLLATALFLLWRGRQGKDGPDPARSCMLAGGIGILLLFLVVPDGFDDAFNAEERIMTPLLIVMMSWLALGLQHAKAVHAAVLVATAFVLIQTGSRIHAFAVMNKSLQEFSEVSAALPNGSAALSVNMERVASYHIHHDIHRPFETLTQFDPQRNFLGNVLAGREVIFASDYEAAGDKPYFALKYQPWLVSVIGDRVPDYLAQQEGEKGGFGLMIDQMRQAPQPIRYLAIWQGAEDPLEEVKPFWALIGRNYHEVFTSSAGHMKLYALD